MKGERENIKTFINSQTIILLKKKIIGKRLFNYILDENEKQTISTDRLKDLKEYIKYIQNNINNNDIIKQFRNQYFKKNDFKTILKKFEERRKTNIKVGLYYNESSIISKVNKEKKPIIITNIYRLKKEYQEKYKNDDNEDRKIELLRNTISYLLDTKFLNKKFIVKLKFYIFDEATETNLSRYITIAKTGTSKDEILKKVDNLYIEGDFQGWGSDAVQDWDIMFLNPIEFQIVEFITYSGGCDNNIYRIIKGAYTVSKSFKSKNNNCLLEIVRKEINIKENNDTIRKKLNISLGVELGQQEIYKIENHFKIRIIIYKDLINDDGQLFILYNGNIEYDNIIKILLKDNHYSLLLSVNYDRRNEIKQELEPQIKDIKQLSKDAEDFLYVFFDFETVSNSKTLKPYYITIECENEIFNIPSTKEAINDYDFNNFNSDVFNIFNNLYNKYNKKILLIGYNSSRFDNFIIFNHLIENEINPRLLYVNNSIMSLQTTIIKTFDLCRFTMRSLKDACRDFKTINKKVDGFDHTIPQNEYYNKTLKQWMINNYDNLKLYCDMDVLALKELFYTLRNKLLELTNDEIDIIKYNTLASAGRAYFTKDYNLYDGRQQRAKLLGKAKKSTSTKQKYILEEKAKAIKKEKYLINGDKKLPIITLEHIQKPDTEENIYIYDFIRSSLTAGRSQMFKTGKYESEIIIIDATSLYPFVMEGGRKNFDCFYPCGDIKQTDKYIDDKLGFYFCDILKQPNKNIIPLRNKDEPLNWTYENEIKNIVLNSVDIEQIKKYNGEIKIYNGVYFTEKTKDIFKTYISFFKNEKIKQDELKEHKSPEYNNALREICKLFLNSLSGKMIENLHDDEFLISRDNDKLEKYINKLSSITNYEDKTNNFYILTGKKQKEKLLQNNNVPHYLGCFIYSYARKWMYDNIIYDYDAWGMDTDSYFMNKTEYEKLLKTKPEIFGGEFGLFKVENYEGGKNKTWDNNYYLAPKCYGNYDTQNPENNKTRFKGIKNNDRYFETKEDYKKFNELKNEDEKFNLFNSLPLVCDNINGNTFMKSSIFEKMINKEKIYIITHQIARNKLNIKNLYLVKKILLETKEEKKHKKALLPPRNNKIASKK